MVADVRDQEAELRRDLRAATPLFWRNPGRDVGGRGAVRAERLAGIGEASARMARFAPLLARLFPELEATGGRIGSPLLTAGAMAAALGLPPRHGRLMIKADHALAVAGSIKARGGAHAVLQIAERVAEAHGLPLDRLDAAPARAVFGRHEIAVGSTGNLGLSVGIFAAALGFSATVHMSGAAKAWKKARLREVGATVIEHQGDYEQAVAAGRAAADRDANAFFIDDENSLPLLFGYATAVAELAGQLAAADVAVDEDHPLFVYVPCGVGGAPAGIALGLAAAFGPAARCCFVEPVGSPCMLGQMLAAAGAHPSVYDLGLDGETEADGLAVPRASLVAADVARPLIDGIFTLDDAAMFRLLALAADTEGLKLEPSAAAGFAGPTMLTRLPSARAYLDDAGLGDRLPNATHLVWTTGGRLLPQAEHDRFVGRGRAAFA